MNEKHTYSEQILIACFYLVVITALLAIPYLFEKNKGLTVYTYSDLIPYEVFKAFEEKTGISVHVKFFSSNEEMFAKLKIDQSSQYDLITPADYMVEILHKEGLLQNIDTTKISQYKNIDKRLLNRFFDPGNKYSIPFVWIVYGLGYNKQFFAKKGLEASWKSIFEIPHNTQKKPEYLISMLDDGREAFFLASLYLYGRIDRLTDQEVEQVTQLLEKQWPLVENYTNSNQPFYLQSGLVPLIVVPNNIMFTILKEQGDSFGFSVPQEGSLISIENIVIPRSCKNVEAVHQLIDFIMTEESSIAAVERFGYLPAHVAAEKKVVEQGTIAHVSDEEMEKLYLLDNNISIEMYTNIWLGVKSVLH